MTTDITLDRDGFAVWLSQQSPGQIVGPGYEAGRRLLSGWLQSIGYDAFTAAGQPGVLWGGRDRDATPWVEAFDTSILAMQWQPVTAAVALDVLARIP